MSVATLYQLYSGYKTARGEISKVKDSGALKVLSLSYQVGMLVVEFAKLKPAVKLGMADKPVEAISVKLRVIVTDLKALIEKTPRYLRLVRTGRSITSRGCSTRRTYSALRPINCNVFTLSNLTVRYLPLRAAKRTGLRENVCCST